MVPRAAHASEGVAVLGPQDAPGVLRGREPEGGERPALKGVEGLPREHHVAGARGIGIPDVGVVLAVELQVDEGPAPRSYSGVLKEGVRSKVNVHDNRTTKIMSQYISYVPISPAFKKKKKKSFTQCKL
jgi:hypothetical protein